MSISRRLFLTSAASLPTLWAMGCAPIGGSKLRPHKEIGSFAWFDLVTDDAPSATKFYENVFGWRFRAAATDDYLSIWAGNQEIGGLLSFDDTAEKHLASSQWIPVMVVDSTGNAANSAVALGAHKLGPTIQTAQGKFQTIKDPTGALVTLYDGLEGFDLNSLGKAGGWAWVDLMTYNTQGASSFYNSLFGFDTHHESTSTNSQGSQIFVNSGKILGGLVKVPKSQVEPNWLPYVGVSDLEATLARALENGAAVLSQTEHAAILIDPTNAAIGITSVSGANQ